MPFEIPRKGDSKERGEIAFECVETAYDEDTLAPRAVSTMVDRYLRGERNFKIIDPNDASRTLLEVTLEDGYPAHEAVLGDVNTEIGKQQRIDISPVTKMGPFTLQGARNKAVGQGILSYHFSDRVIDHPNRAFHRGRVTEGCAGLAISPTMYPKIGWGLKVQAIPLRNLVFLPINCRADEVTAIVWREYLPLNVVKNHVSLLSRMTEGKVKNLPTQDSPDYPRILAREVPFGRSAEGGLGDTIPAGMFSGKDSRLSGGKKRRTGKFVLFTRIFFTDDMVLLNRRMVLVGKYLILDEEYNEFERPYLPIAVSTYAAVGGPYGRSYAQARIAANIRNESVLNTLMRNFKDTDAYGLLAMSTGMGLSIDQMMKQGQGFKVVNYTNDANSPGAQPLQLQPIPMDRIFRSMGVMMSLGEGVFPDSPLNQGKSVGRVDSDAAIARLDRLGQIAIRAGAESARSAWVQMYRAGLEMARAKHSDGDKVPIFHLTPDLAGVIVDVEEIPRSQQEVLRQTLVQAIEAERGGQPVDMEESPAVQRQNLVPVPRFTIGPNIIPSPSEVTIDIRSMLPRDENAEFEEIVTAVKLGASSIMEAQIEMMERNLPRFFGGKMVRATYSTAVLNLLSAFGDGTESGPILIQPHVFAAQVGYWIMSCFIAEPLFGLASKTVKNKVMQLLFLYAPVNHVGGQMTADESLAAFGQQQQQRMLQQRGMGMQTPQLPQGI